MVKVGKNGRQTKSGPSVYKGGGGFWFLGFIGSLVYYWGGVESFWLFLVAVFKSVFWPAYLVYGLLKALSL